MRCPSYSTYQRLRLPCPDCKRELLLRATFVNGPKQSSRQRRSVALLKAYTCGAAVDCSPRHHNPALRHHRQPHGMEPANDLAANVAHLCTHRETARGSVRAICICADAHTGDPLLARALLATAKANLWAASHWPVVHSGSFPHHDACR